MSAPVLIVDDHELVGTSLLLSLRGEGLDAHLSCRGDADGVLRLTSRLAPGVVLLDLDLGRFGDGMRLISPLATTGINVVVVTSSIDRSRWGEAIRCGARTVLSKALPLSSVLATVRRINAGLPVLTFEEREDLLRAWRQQRSELQSNLAKLSLLTARESQVLGELMRGQTVHDIAVRSVVSEATVRTQVKSILSKLEVSSQLAAVGLAHQVGWKPPL